MAILIQAILNGITDGAFLAMIALGITLIFGVAGFPNVAHGDFLTVGAYATLLLAALHLPLPVATLGGVVVTVLLGLLSYALIFRRIGDRPITALLASIGLSIFIRSTIGFTVGSGQQSFDLPMWRSWRIGGLRILPIDVYITIASFLTIGVVHLILRYTRIGVEMRAVSDNATLARTSGINPARISVATWSIALAVAALAGVFVGAKTAVNTDLGWGLLLPGFAAAILGGLGSPYGAILAGLLLGLAQNVAVVWLPDTYKVTFSFLILIVALLLRPSGLAGRREVAR